MFARLIFTLILGLCTTAQAGEPNRFAATIVAAERFNVGGTLVERHGKGPAMVLVPGLASGSWVWQETVRQFAPTHTVYVLTLPGFDGHPALADQGLTAARDSLRQLLVTRKPGRAVVVGHGLGGTMALELAARHPELVRGVVTIDGMPVFPGTEDWVPEQRKAMAGMMAARRATPAAFIAQQQQYMSGTGTLDMSRAEELAKLSSRSDPGAVTRYMADGVALDLRSVLPSITAPVLALSPYAPVDGDQLQMTEDGKTDFYRTLMKGAPDVTVQSISPARHFAMFDQPQKITEAIRNFVSKLPRQ